MIRSAYLAAEGFTRPLAEELTLKGVTIADWHGELALSPDPPVEAAWSLNTWLDVREIEVASIGQTAASLRAIQRNWGAYTPLHHRRMALVAEKLPPLRPKPILFPQPAPTGHLGAWTLLSPERLLCSPRQTSPYINGAPEFVEDRAGPPSRAYLKLWEALTLFGAFPEPGQRCMDLGASPGGWSWVLASLGAQVVAVDKAALDPAVASMPNVETRQESAFAIEPANEAPVDWLCSDIIAYPERLLGLVRAWIAAGKAARIICTLKFQAETDHARAAEFAAIPGARVLHLHANKHELTFMWARASVPTPTD